MALRLALQESYVAATLHAGLGFGFAFGSGWFLRRFLLVIARRSTTKDSEEAS